LNCIAVIDALDGGIGSSIIKAIRRVIAKDTDSAVVLVPQLFNPRLSVKPKNTKIQLYLGKGLSTHFG
jgi:hypothetical protein